MASIYDYAVIGDCRTAALISREGSLDWLSWPRFDSPSVFSKLLDEQGGYWSLMPVAPFRCERRYIPDTNVLEVTFKTDKGHATLINLMPMGAAENSIYTPEREILRALRCDEGEMGFEMICYPRPGYGNARVRTRHPNERGIRFESGGKLLALSASVGLVRDVDRALSGFQLRQGENAYFSLTYSVDLPAGLQPADESTEQRIEATTAWWRNWTARCTYRGEYREQVKRSALALKLLAYAPSGAYVAAPTTSLPEIPGGDYNWDYRFCWLRDASLTTRALAGLGYREEASAFVNWLLHATRLSRPELRIAYTVYGRSVPKERDLRGWEGFQHARPVRIGNGARRQLQLDTYGEVIDAVSRLVGNHSTRLDRETQGILVDFGEFICRHWQTPDHGIWELRGAPAQYTHSKVLCWASLDRLICLHESGELQGIPVDTFRKNRRWLRQAIENRGWNEALSSYTQTFQGAEVDAALILLPWFGFEKADSPRMRGTHRAIRERLSTHRGLYRRLESVPREGAFLACGFWVAEYLALGGGTFDEATGAFLSIADCANDVGLFAEEFDAGAEEALGNFPQGFSHIGLINAALSLEERRSASDPLRRIA